ncbi:hypothetical protein GCM10017717_22740 [Deinococcus persicinus]
MIFNQSFSEKRLHKPNIGIAILISNPINMDIDRLGMRQDSSTHNDTMYASITNKLPNVLI